LGVDGGEILIDGDDAKGARLAESDLTDVSGELAGGEIVEGVETLGRIVIVVGIEFGIEVRPEGFGDAADETETIAKTFGILEFDKRQREQDGGAEMLGLA